MKFKVDENLPTERAAMLQDAGHEADTVADQKLTGSDDSVLFERCQAEGRILLKMKGNGVHGCSLPKIRVKSTLAA